MKVTAIGLGYVGTVTAACLASRGHDVWGVDVDAVKVNEIRAGRSPVTEPGLDSLVAQVVALNCPVPMEFVALQGYAMSGKPAELLEKYGLTAGGIQTAVQKVLGRKSGGHLR